MAHMSLTLPETASGLDIRILDGGVRFPDCSSISFMRHVHRIISLSVKSNVTIVVRVYFRETYEMIVMQKKSKLRDGKESHS